jgi:hypothetical protein
MYFIHFTEVSGMKTTRIVARRKEVVIPLAIPLVFLWHSLFTHDIEPVDDRDFENRLQDWRDAYDMLPNVVSEQGHGNGKIESLPVNTSSASCIDEDMLSFVTV